MEGIVIISKGIFQPRPQLQHLAALSFKRKPQKEKIAGGTRPAGKPALTLIQITFIKIKKLKH